MAENWNSVFPTCGSHDYSQIPTHDPGPDNDDSFQFRRIRSRSAIDVPDSRSLQREYSSIDDETQEDLPRMNRHTVQIGALSHLESQTPLTDQEEVVVENPSSCSSFVERSWFQAISAVVIISNVITTIVEMDKPQTKDLFFVSDRAMLAFYVLELCLRLHYFGVQFWCGPLKFVCWNILDIIVVVAGVLDQLLMPMLPVAKHGSVSKVLQLLRLLRLLRVFKIVRVFLDIDLSWTEAPAFQSFIGMIIAINSLLMGMEIDIPWHGWFYFEQVLLCIYVFELSVRLKNFGTFFFSCNNEDFVWNVLDFIIVSSSVLDSWITPLCGVIMKSLSGADATSQKKQHGMDMGKVMLLMRMLRLMRILRLVKLVKSVRPLFILVTGVLAALQGVAWVLVLTVVTLYAMGILATSLIGKKMAFGPGSQVPEESFKPFSTVPNSMFTLFRVMSGAASDTEISAIDVLMENCPVIKLGFVFFMITSSWTLLSILTAVVSENMISTTGQQEEEIKLETAEEDRLAQVSKLKEIFRAVDISGDGLVEAHEIEEFLSDKNNAVLTARRCRVPVRDVRDLLQTVVEACDEKTISFDRFVEYLADVSNVVTEKGIMKLEAKMTNIGIRQSQAFLKLTNMFLSWQDQSDDAVAAKLESATEACSKALEHKAETVCEGQLKEIERFMQEIAERTEACLNEIQQKNQRFFSRMTEALEQALPKFGVDKFAEVLEFQLHRMQHEFLCSMRGQASDIPKMGDGISNGAAGAPAVIKRNLEEPPSVVNESQADVADIASESGFQVELSATQTRALLLATEESMRNLQHKTESMLRKNAGLLEKMSKAVDQGLSALAFDKLSETLESELRMIRRELLLCVGQQSPNLAKTRDDAREHHKSEDGKQRASTAVKFQTDLAGRARSSNAQAETLKREPRMSQQEWPASRDEQDPHVSKEREALQKGSGPATTDATSTGPGMASSATPASSVVDDIGSFPNSTSEREV